MKELKNTFVFICTSEYGSTAMLSSFASHDIYRGKILHSSFSHGWARLPFLRMTSYRGDLRSARLSFHFLKGRKDSQSLV